MDPCQFLTQLPATHYNICRKAEKVVESPPLQLRLGLSKAAAAAARKQVVPSTRNVVQPGFAEVRVVFSDGSVPMAPVGPLTLDREAFAPVSPCTVRGVFLETKTVLTVLVCRELPLSSFYTGRSFRLVVILGGASIAVSSPFWSCGKQPRPGIQPKAPAIAKTTPHTLATQELMQRVRDVITGGVAEVAHPVPAFRPSAKRPREPASKPLPPHAVQARAAALEAADQLQEVFNEDSVHSFVGCTDGRDRVPTKAQVPVGGSAGVSVGASTSTEFRVPAVLDTPLAKLSTSKLHVMAYLDPQRFEQHREDLATMRHVADVAERSRGRLDSLDDFCVPEDALLELDFEM